MHNDFRTTLERPSDFPGRRFLWSRVMLPVARTLGLAAAVFAALRLFDCHPEKASRDRPGSDSGDCFSPARGTLVRRGTCLLLLLALAGALGTLPVYPAFAQDAAPLWSADMSVAELGNGSIGAFSAGDFTNQGGRAGLQAKRLYYYGPNRTLRLAFTEGVRGEELTLKVGTLTLSFPPDSRDSSFTWHDVGDVGWKDGQTIPVRIVEGANTPATGVPAITGRAEAGETLTADTSGISDADGMDNATFSYQWIANDANTDADIEGETDPTYDLADSDVGKTVKVRVSFVDDDGLLETLTSAATAAIGLPSNTPARGAPVISGRALEGETLTADTTDISDADGLANATFSYQWFADDADIQDATDSSYTVADGDEGKAVKVEATFTDDSGNEETLTSAATAEVTAPPLTSQSISPSFPATETGARSVAENTAAGVDFGDAFVATDPEMGSVSYSLGGPGAALFAIDASSGQLRTAAALDHEEQPTHSLTVIARDASGLTAEIDVTITVTNVDEAGSLSFLPTRPQVGTVLKATLSDPDGIDRTAWGDTPLVWNWERSSDQSSWEEITDFGTAMRPFGPPYQLTRRANYTPTTADLGKYLRATVTYLDNEGPGKTVEKVLPQLVGGRAPAPEITVVELVSGLTHPWGLAFAPDGTMLFTERGGGLNSRLPDGTVQMVSADLSDLGGGGERGMLGLVVDPDFATNRRFYTCSGHTGGPWEMQVIAWSINNTYTEAVRIADPLVGGIPSRPVRNGCRLRFGPEGFLWITTGDAEIGTSPQDLASLGGKVLRVDPSTGAGAPTNPFAQAPLVYTYGHRNPQGLARRPGTNQMWSVEHGTGQDDEINLLVSGGNYGWDPDANPGYNGRALMTDLEKFPEAVEAKWSSGYATPAASGGIFLEGSDWGEWEGRLAVATLKTRSVRIFEFTATGTFVSQVMVPELDGTYGRLRTPMLGPDGGLYLTSSNGDGRDRILKVVPVRPSALGAGPLTKFTVVDTSSDPDDFLGTLEDGGTLILDNPANGSYGIRVDTESGVEIGSVRLQLTGKKSVYRIEGVSPYSLYGGEGNGALHGGSLPDGAYTLTATAYSEADSGGDILGTLEVSFTVAAANSPAAGAPIISGAAQVGETLTADTSGIADADGLEDVSYSYQWIDGGSDIFGATESSYTLTDDEEGRTVRVRVSFTDDAGNEETLTSAATEAVAPRPSPQWSADMRVVKYTSVSIGASSADLFSNVRATGGLQVKQIWSQTWNRYLRLELERAVPYADELTLQVGGLSLEFPAGSSGEVNFKWEDVDVDWEDGQTIPARIVLTSTLAEPAPNTPATGAPSIAGTAQVGETLTADVSGIADEDGLEDASFSYQWLSDDTDIDEATEATYTLIDADVDRIIRVRVSFQDAAGNEETLTSEPTAAVAAKTNNPATGTPTISGTAQVSEMLTANVSGIADEDGLDNAAFAYQWTADDADIEGATNSTYTLADADEGKNIRVRVSFTDDAGNEETLASAATERVGEKAMAPGQPRHLRVFPHDAQGLDASWEAPQSDGGSPITGYTVQWKEVGGSWDSPADVSQAAVGGTAHTIGGLTDGMEYAVRVIAGNGVGDSAPSAEAWGTPRETDPPQLVMLGVEGATLRVSYDEDLDEDSAPPADAFDVRAVVRGDGTLWQEEKARRAVDFISIGGGTVMLTLASAATSEDYVVIKYTPPSEEGSARVRDAAGNAAAGFGFAEVKNDTEKAGEKAEEPSNTPATGLPAISGTARVGETLTADTSGIADADGLSNATFSYQWIRGGGDANIQGATGSTYTLTDSDEGKAIKVRVYFTDDRNNEETRTSEATGAVAAEANSPATGIPTISGTVQVGETLTASTTDISDADGLDNVSYSYQWMADSTNIAGATASTYTLTDSDVGKTIKARVSFTDDANNQETLTSEPTATVEARPNNPPTGAPTISDSEAYVTVEIEDGGDTVSWSDPGNCSSDYNLYMAVRPHGNDAETSRTHLGSAASGSNETTVAISHEEPLSPTGVSHLPKVEVELYCGEYEANNLVSSTQIAMGAFNLREGTYSSAPLTALTISSGTLNPSFDRGINEYDAEVPSDTESITLESTVLTGYFTEFVKNPGWGIISGCWGGPLRGTCNYSYGNGTTTGIVLNDADEETEGFQINLGRGENRLGIGVNTGNVDNGLGSLYYLMVTVQNSPATGQPTISGTAQVGQTLTADISGIADSDGLTNVTFNYQWLADDTDIEGATSSTYTLADSDAGKTVKVKVSFTDDAGNQETLTSAATAAVVGAESDIEPNVGYVTVVVQENNSDPDTPATDFTVTWNDPEECSDGYSAYISGWAGSVLDLGSTDSDGTQIAKTVPQSDLEGGLGYGVEVYCGVRDPNWYIAPARVPEYGPSHFPVPGTYSSEPGLTGLTVTEGSLAPSFHQYRFLHTLEDVPSDAKRITLNATVKAGYSVVFLDHNVTVMGSCNGSECGFTYEETGSDNKVEPLKDADEDLDGFQMDLADDQTHFSIHVPTVLGIGRVYRFSLDRLIPEPPTEPGGQDGNTPATDLPAISGTAQVGQSLVADTSGIDDADGLTNVSYSYQWIRRDGNTDTDIAETTGSTYTLVSADVGKAIKVRATFTDDAGHEESLTSAATEIVAATAPGPPQHLNVSPHGAGALDLYWEAPASDGGSPITGHKVQWKESAGSWDTPADVSEAMVSGTTHTIDGLTGGMEYAIRVRAGNGVGDGPASVEVVAEAPGGWSAELTVGVEDEYAGYSFFAGVGSLSDNDFSVDGVTHVVGALIYDAETLYFSLNREMTAGFVLLVGPAELASGDATVQEGGIAHTYRWAEPGLDWSAGDTVAVGLALAEATGEEQTGRNAPATGLSIISGSAQVGETLTADVSGIADADGLENAAFSYQWTADDADIDGATSSAYTPADSDVGKTVKVKVSFTDDAGNEETLTSEATDTVAPPPNRPATGAPSIRGVLQDQESLTADTVGIADADGLHNATISYRWIRVTDGNSSEITGQTSSTYTLTANDVGNSIQLRVAFNDDRGQAESIISAVTEAVVASDATRELLWLSTMTPEDPDGLDADFNFDPSGHAGSLSPAGFTDGEDTRAITFLGASFASDTTLALELDLEPTAAQIATWRLALHDTELGFSDAAMTQTDTNPPCYRFQWDVTALAVDDRDLWDDGDALTVSLLEAINLKAAGVPTISGIPQVNETLNAATTGIADGNGLDSAAYTYWWTAGGTDIDGATGSSLTLTSSQEGQTIQVRVTFTDDDGFSETATSIATDTVAAAEQANNPAMGLPTVGGTPQVEQTLTADTSAIADQDGLSNVSYRYQWMAGGADIAGAMGSSLTLTASHQGQTADRGRYGLKSGCDIAWEGAPPSSILVVRPPDAGDPRCAFPANAIRCKKRLKRIYLTSPSHN